MNLANLTQYASSEDDSSVEPENNGLESGIALLTPEPSLELPSSRTNNSGRTYDDNLAARIDCIKTRIRALDNKNSTNLKTYDPSVSEVSSNSITSFLSAGVDITENIRSMKDFGNPYILQKVVDHYKIDDIGSNFPVEIFNPHGYEEEDYEDNIKKFAGTSTEKVGDIARSVSTSDVLSVGTVAAQAIAMRHSVSMSTSLSSFSSQVASGGVTHQTGYVANAEDQPKKKKSRWDSA